MARRQSPDKSIGDRIQARRALRGWTVRFAADRAGLSHSTWSRIERGLVSADNRFTLASIAEALGCSVMDLAGGQQSPPADADAAAAQLAVGPVRQALIETDPDEPATCDPRPLPEVIADAVLISDLRLKCDYAGAGRLLPDVLRELHAHTHGPDRAAALRALARTADVAGFVMRYIGYPAEAWIAADRAQSAAVALGDPVILGLAAWSLGHAATGSGAYGRALNIAEAAVGDLERATGEPGGYEMLGQMQMLAAYSHLALGRRDEAMTWAQQAEQIGARTGDTTTLGLMFGPTGMNLWWISMETDGGEPGRAVEIARRTNPTAIPAVSRHVSYYADTGRALARLGRDDEAVRLMLVAERVAPQRLHVSSLARETVRGLLERSPDSGAGQIRGLAERMGVLL